MSRMHRHRLKLPHRKLRFLIQLLSACFLNGYAAGFANRTIFTGKTKLFCVPVLNCYSCPGAFGACPIGAMQTIAAGRRGISFYALGTVTLFGVIFGRMLCGWICPFGWIQDLLSKIPVRKWKIPQKTDRILRFLKYGVLLFFVLLLPAVITNDFGTGTPWFCKYICPAGTLEGGVPLLLLNAKLRSLAGALFSWKLAVLLAVIIGSVVVRRFFCRYLCPLGAFYALFNRFAFYQMQADAQKCTHCGRCSKVCPMALQVPDQICSGECIRCGECKQICPEGAITDSFRHRQQTEKKS